MEIRNPRRILFIGPPDSGVLKVLEDLTGSAPAPRIVPKTQPTQAHDSEQEAPSAPDVSADEILQTSVATESTTAGLNHSLSLKNAYYSAQIPIWIDETTSPEEWKQDFLTEEAGEVVRAIGAWVLCFRMSPSKLNKVSGKGLTDKEPINHAEWLKSMMTAVRDVIEKACGGVELWDGVLLCVGVPSYSVASSNLDENVQVQPDWEDLCWDQNFEFINSSIKAEAKSTASGESKGVKRLKEALEANDWNGDIEDIEEDDFGVFSAEMEQDSSEAMDFLKFGSTEDAGFTLERHEMEKEMFDLKMALSQSQADHMPDQDGHGDGEQVEELQNMMSKLLAVKDRTAHMPEAERKKFAARAVRDIMDTM